MPPTPQHGAPRIARDPAILKWVPPGARWGRLHGGRTNRTWRVEGGTTALVVKLYARAGDTPLFPNDPGAEFAALRHLEGQGLAPQPLALAQTVDGPCLIYRHVAGQQGQVAPVAMGKALRRLHGIAPPHGLRPLPGGSAAIMAQARRILADCAKGTHLQALCPDLPDIPAASRPVFLHGDPVPANALDTADGPCLIDWQCPAIGDPAEDLAICLSPAMGYLYGDRPLPDQSALALLTGYGDAGVVARYRALAPLFHWRMAVYCQWRAEQDAPNAGLHLKAQDLELAALRAAVP